MTISRRLITFGGLASICTCMASTARTAVSHDGCVYYGSNDGASVDDVPISEKFPGLSRGTGHQREIALGPIIVEMFQLFELTPAIGYYDDTKTCSGNAAATPKALFPAVPKSPFKVEGTIILGTKLLNTLSQYEHETAAIAAACAHEFGHILQFKYVSAELEDLEGADGRIVRSELFADFICGYHAGIRKLRQDEYPAAIQALNQFRAGDHMFDKRKHHGTPEERARSVFEGFKVGSAGRIVPEAIARLGLQYVRGLKLRDVDSETGCESVDSGVKR
jgi:hypothetical protein